MRRNTASHKYEKTRVAFLVIGLRQFFLSNRIPRFGLFFDDKGREKDALFDTFPILCIGTKSGVCEASLGVIYAENIEQILRLVGHKWL